jgi:hypothetical protein
MEARMLMSGRNALLMIALIVMLCATDALATCAGTADYVCVACTQGETGSCRQPKDLTLTKVQAVVDASDSSDGTYYRDGVYLMAGTATWADLLDLSAKKGLVLKGNGTTNTVLNIAGDQAIDFGGADMSRVTGIHFHTAAGSHPVWGWARDFRVDHCLFTGAFSIGIWWYDGHHNTGLVDHNVFNFTTDGGTAVYIRDVGGYISSPIDFGSADWVFVEDNVFNNLGSPEMIENQDLGKLVIRYNTFNEISPSNMQTLFEQHNTGEGSGGRAQEVYGNKIYYNSPPGDFIRMLYWRHGTGLFYDNMIDYSKRGVEPTVLIQLRGYRTAGGIGHDDFSDETDCADWSTNTADTPAPELGAGMLAKCCSPAYSSGTYRGEGYPCVGQPGQGVYHGSAEPIYFWDNKKTADGTTMQYLTADDVDVADTEKWAIQLGRDYCVSNTGKPASCGGHILDYTPYQYPHPLTLPGQLSPCSQLGICCVAGEACSGTLQSASDCPNCCIGICATQSCGNSACSGSETCTSCPADCYQTNPSDVSPCDGCIEIGELQAYIGRWRTGSVQLSLMMEAIRIWKQGC